MFCAHGGQYDGRRAAIIMQNHCIPIACSHWSYGERRAVAEFGIHACWEACMDVEDFFAHLGIEAVREPSSTVGLPDGWRPEGLYVYEIEYDEAGIDPSADEDWSHLAGGELRRPTIREVKPLTQGLAPWEGTVL